MKNKVDELIERLQGKYGMNPSIEVFPDGEILLHGWFTLEFLEEFAAELLRIRDAAPGGFIRSS